MSELKCVDERIIYNKLDDVVSSYKHFDILCHGFDNRTEICLRAFQWAKDNNKQVIEPPRTEKISSSILRKFIKNHEI